MRSLLVFLVFFWGVLASQSVALTAEDCIDIKARYGVLGPGCADLPNEVAKPNPAQTARSSGPSSANPATQEQRQNHVFFPNGGARIDDAARAQLTRIAALLETPLLRETCVQLIGHSDISGSDQANLETGMRRGEAVSKVMKDMLDNPNRVTSLKSQGEWQTLDNLPGGHVYQRRVEIRLRTCAPDMVNESG